VLNALDAMPLGGTLRVSVEASEDPRGVSVRLADTGVGIPAADMEHLFEPFRSTKTDGLGLGLFICHNIIVQHSGRLEVDSEEGKGTEVRVWLPA
jgi:signal transduction histidine kinase